MEYEPKPPRDYKDRLFKAIYGRDTDESKRWRLELYNALNGTSYTDPDAFIRKDDVGDKDKKNKPDKCPQDFEWTATVININPGHNSALQKNCKPLYDYVRYVGRIKDNQKNGMPVKEAVDDAVNWAIELDLLDGFFSINKAEVIAMCLTEFDVESAIKTWREDGYDEGRADGKQEKAVEVAQNLLKDGRYTAQEIASLLNIPVEAFSASSSN